MYLASLRFDELTRVALMRRGVVQQLEVHAVEDGLAGRGEVLVLVVEVDELSLLGGQRALGGSDLGTQFTSDFLHSSGALPKQMVREKNKSKSKHKSKSECKINIWEK